MPARKAKKFSRLSRDVVPERYAITLEPDLKKFVFGGTETIDLILAKPVRKITLHSKDLDIESAEIMNGRSVVAAAAISYDPDSETAIFDFRKSLPRGRCKLTIVWSGKLNDSMRGFYRSSYMVGKETRYIATTQFEATDARRAFPCFDEPAAKAVFEVSFIVPKDKVAISNTIPVAVRHHTGGTKTVEFAPTPKMSTYLLAFIVGDFEHIQKRTPEGVLVRVFTTSDKKHQAKFALDCAAKTISFFARYFDIPYPLPVLDMIAIPDFASGAMENWGAITYRESALLFDEEHSSSANKQWVALVIAHEIAHQWFGNLVTMEWWTHLWLNEGFASYIEYVAVDHIFPEWNIWNHFFSADLGRALKLDGLKHTHPIEVAVRHPGEISEIFDTVSYSKGASVIRMLADYLGEDAFRKGLTHYLKKHSYANTETDHLWQAFQKISKKPVRRMMKGWTQTAGYPLITVSKDKKGLRVTQARFFSSSRSKEDKGKTSTWIIPIRSIQVSAKNSKLSVLARTSGRIGDMKDDGWLKLNAGEAGFFRTNYPREFWERFSTPILEKEFAVGDRLGLIRDAAALAEAGHLSVVDMLEFSRHYHRETEYFVWLEIASAIKQAYLLIAKEPFALAYRKFAQGIFAEIAAKMGWNSVPDEAHSQKLLRNLVLSQFGYYGDFATVDRARKMFSRVASGKNKISPDLRDAVYNLVAQNGDARDHAKLLRLYGRETLHEEKNRIGSALGRFKSKTLLTKTLAFSISKNVRVQDTPSVLGSVWLNPYGRALAWTFVKKNWKLLVERYGDGHTLSRIVSLAGSFNSEREAREIERFFKANIVPLAVRRTLRQALEQVRGNAAWIQRDKKKLGRWLV